jgi:hypothetical protein
MSPQTSFARLTPAALAIAATFLMAAPARVSSQEGGQQFRAHPSTQESSRLVTLDKLKQWEKELSNWGRWGKDDQRGLLNLITAEKTKHATTLVQ